MIRERATSHQRTSHQRTNHKIMLLSIKNITKSFDGLKAVDDFSCDIRQGELIGLIGPNGAGKTTLFNVLTGFLKANAGNIQFNDQNITGLPPEKITRSGISRTFQDLRLIMDMSLLENVMLWSGNNPGEKLSRIFFRRKNVTGFEKENTENAIALLKFAGLEEKANDYAGNLSYGQQKLLSLACCLASEPALILLDEPVSGIQPQMIEKIIEMIHSMREDGKTIFFIEHDMDFVFKVAKRVIVMDDGKKIADDRPGVIRENTQILESYLA